MGPHPLPLLFRKRFGRSRRCNLTYRPRVQRGLISECLGTTLRRKVLLRPQFLLFEHRNHTTAEPPQGSKWLTNTAGLKPANGPTVSVLLVPGQPLYVLVTGGVKTDGLPPLPLQESAISFVEHALHPILGVFERRKVVRDVHNIMRLYRPRRRG